MNPVPFFRREQERPADGAAVTCLQQENISDQNTEQEGEADGLLLLYDYAKKYA